MSQDLEAQTGASSQAIRSGYPRFAELLHSDDGFRVFRRFTRVRMRLLLAQQDKVSMLEARLESIDRDEKCPLFLGSMRMDRNQERRLVMRDLKRALGEYDKLMEQTKFATTLPDPDGQDVGSLIKWMGSTGFNGEESQYLEKGADLASLATSSDRAVKIVETVMTKGLAYLDETVGDRFPWLWYKPVSRLSDEMTRVFILTPLLRGVSRTIAICLVSLIMLLPTLVLPRLTSLAERASASVITAAVVLVAVAFLTRARTIELVACGASYTAVIVALTVSESSTTDMRMSDMCKNGTAG